MSDTTFSLFHTDNQKLLVYDFKGNLINQYNTKPKEQDKREMIILYGQKPLIYNDGLFLPTLLSFNNGKGSIDSTYEQYAGYYLTYSDTANQLEQETKFKYPPHYYKGKVYNDAIYHFAKGDNESIVFSFEKSDSIFIYDFKGNKRAEFMGSSISHHFNPYDPNSNLAQTKKYFEEEPAYYFISYDPYRKVYIRSYTDRLIVNKDMMKKPSRKSSYIILNKDFKLLGEYLIDWDKDSPTIGNEIFTEEGIWNLRINRSEEDNHYKIKLLCYQYQFE
ncbi:MAG: DUF4221 family protein [Hyphomicrobiales bacterium]